MGLGLGCDNFCLSRWRGEGFWRWVGRGGGGVEICVTNYLARLTSSLRAKFEVEKMSDFFACCQDSANLKTEIG